jgi:hypothetical protein
VFEDALQILRDRHRFDSADVRSAGVALRHPDPGEQGRGHDAFQLSSYLALVTTPPRDTEHRDMSSDMQQRASLAEDVRTLEVSESLRQVARLQTGITGVELEAIGRL